MRLEEISNALHGLNGIDNAAWWYCRKDEDLAGMGSSLVKRCDAILWSPSISLVKEAMVRKQYLGKLHLVDVVGLPVVVGRANGGVDRVCVSEIGELNQDATINCRKIFAAMSMGTTQLLFLYEQS